MLIDWLIANPGYFRDILKLGQIGHGDNLPLGKWVCVMS